MRLVVDRIEEAWAVCYDSDDESLRFDIPLRYLPPGVREGDHLRVTFEIDRESRDREKRKAEELLRQLTRHQDAEQKKFKL